LILPLDLLAKQIIRRTMEVMVYSKILSLRFPKTHVQKPIVCNLTRNYDLVFNILNAGILPRKEGFMVLELSGTRKNISDGVQYLKSQGVDVQNASQEVKRDDKTCVQCGACTAVCPTGALTIQRPEMTVVFDQKKCIVCELCVPACPPRAMKVRPLNQAFF
jgi:ferredoxin